MPNVSTQQTKLTREMLNATKGGKKPFVLAKKSFQGESLHPFPPFSVHREINHAIHAIEGFCKQHSLTPGKVGIFNNQGELADQSEIAM